LVGCDTVFCFSLLRQLSLETRVETRVVPEMVMLWRLKTLSTFSNLWACDSVEYSMMTMVAAAVPIINVILYLSFLYAIPTILYKGRPHFS
jgi:hypothetical protein